MPSTLFVKQSIYSIQNPRPLMAPIRTQRIKNIG